MVHHAAEITLSPATTARGREFYERLAAADYAAGPHPEIASALLDALADAPPADTGELLSALHLVASSLAHGHSVTLSRHDATVTTQEAADVLGISRPTLVRLLDQGAIPFSQPSRHRRMLLADVLAYQASHDTIHPHPEPAAESKPAPTPPPA